jgi:hypothetical protein
VKTKKWIMEQFDEAEEALKEAKRNLQPGLGDSVYRAHLADGYIALARAHYKAIEVALAAKEL